MLAMLNKLGHKTAFIGKVGDDLFRKQLRDAITEYRNRCNGLMYRSGYPYDTCYCTYLPGWRQRFSFYRNPGADMMLK